MKVLNGSLNEFMPVREEGKAKRYRHKKRGTEYTLIGVGRAQGELQDDDPVVLYRGDDGGLWVRHQVEFCDGRFEEVSTLATCEEAPAEAEKLQMALEWYGEQARLARLIHSEGDKGRQALADDGGKRARQALANLQQEN